MGKIASLNTIKTLNSLTQVKEALNHIKEYKRQLKEYSNDVFTNLSELNYVYYDKNLLEELGDVKVNTKTKDVFEIYCNLNTVDFEKQYEKDTTFLLSRDEWIELYKEKIDAIKEFGGKDFHIVCAALHMDQAHPHLQLLAVQRTKDNAKFDEQKVLENLYKQFSRKNAKNKGTNSYLQSNSKEYKKERENYVKANYEKQANKEKEKHMKKIIENGTKSEYRYSTNNISKMGSYIKFNDYMFRKDQDNKMLQKLMNRINELTDDDFEFVRKKNSTFGNVKSTKDIKDSIEIRVKNLQKKVDNDTATDEEKEILRQELVLKNLKEKKSKMTVKDYIEEYNNYCELEKLDNKSSLDSILKDKQETLEEIKNYETNKDRLDDELRETENSLENLKKEISRKNNVLQKIDDYEKKKSEYEKELKDNEEYVSAFKDYKKFKSYYDSEMSENAELLKEFKKYKKDYDGCNRQLNENRELIKALDDYQNKKDEYEKELNENEDVLNEIRDFKANKDKYNKGINELKDNYNKILDLGDQVDTLKYMQEKKDEIVKVYENMVEIFCDNDEYFFYCSKFTEKCDRLRSDIKDEKDKNSASVIGKMVEFITSFINLVKNKLKDELKVYNDDKIPDRDTRRFDL